MVRASNYAVEWWNGGRPTQGPANAYRPVRVTAADKDAWLARQGDGIGVMVENNNGQLSTTFRRGGGRGRQASADDYEWPETKPPFVAGGVVTAPTGDLWVPRYVAANDAPAYDVFGPDGRLLRRVVLPVGRRLEGFGNRAIYLSRADDSDLRYLEKYAAP